MKGVNIMADLFHKTDYRIAGGKLLNELLKIRPRQCECCKRKTWMKQPITLEVHHIDGDNTNNELSNLQLLCPNCHSYTDNWRVPKKKSEVTDSQLIQALKTSKSIHQALVKVGLSTAGHNYERARLLIEKDGISMIAPTPIKKYEEHKCTRCGKILKTDSRLCQECVHILQRVVQRPDRDTLKQLVRNKPFTIIAEQYGVSDKAIAKWCIAENLPSKKREINKMTDEEWNQI